MPPNIESAWTDAEIAIIRAAANAGKSAGQAVRELIGRTRSAILGKAKRLGLTFGIGGKPNPGAAARRRRAKPRPERTTPFRSPPVRSLAERLRLHPDIGSLTSARLTLLDLTFVDGKPAECRYPIEGERETMIYCGNPVEHGQSYCLPHCAKCFSPR